MKLSDRVEAMDGADRGMDAEVFKGIGAPVPFQFMNKLIALEFNDVEQAYFARVTDDMQVRYSPPHYTSSLDAALTLFETIPDTIPSCPRKCVVQALKERGL